MPVILAVVGVVTAVLFFVLRARNAAHAATEAVVERERRVVQGPMGWSST